MRMESDEERLAQAVVMLNHRVLSLALGIVTGVGLFVATNWLVLKGGNTVGPHLGLLSQYFYGYRVSFAGSFVGLVYGFLVGYFAGWIISKIYNRVVSFKQGGFKIERT